MIASLLVALLSGPDAGTPDAAALPVHPGRTYTFRAGDRVHTFTTAPADPKHVWDAEVHRQAAARSSKDAVSWGPYVLVPIGNETRLYRHGMHHWTIPNRLKPGMTWASTRLMIGCGMAAMNYEARATADRITVPAGTINALRIDLGRPGDERVIDSLWIAPGVGIVKYRDRGRWWELSKPPLRR